MVKNPKGSALARRVARVHRAFLAAFAQAFPGTEYPADRELDVPFLLHHVEADCCGRVEWAIATAVSMVDDPAARPASFASMWLADRFRGSNLTPARERAQRRELRREILESASYCARRAGRAA